MAAAGKTRNATEYNADEALVQIVEDAFNNQTAVIIAGYDGQDTLLACRVVAAKILGGDQLPSALNSAINGTQVVLDTSGTSISEVTVKEYKYLRMDRLENIFNKQ